MKLKGFIGPAYTLESLNVDAQACVNLFPRLVESGTGKEGQVAYLKSTPGKELLTTVGAGPIRLLHRDLFGRIFCVSGNKLYSLTESGGVWSATLLSALSDPAGGAAFTFDTSSGPMKAASFSQAGDGTDSTTVFVDGTSSYYYWDKIGLQDVLAKHGGGQGVSNGSHIAWIDGYFIVNNGGQNRFQVSDLADFLFTDQLEFESSEGDPDLILALEKLNRALWVFNQRTTEVYQNTGNASFPFERVQGGFIEIGCAAKFSVAKINQSIFWLSRNEDGQGIVYAASGVSPQRISTHAIETAFAGYADISTATAYTYQDGGHFFYVLNFAEASWAFDTSTGLWHQRAYLNSGVLERDRADVCVFDPDHGFHLVGDYSTNKVYRFNNSYYSDAGDAIKRLRAAPHLSGGLKRVFCSSFQLDMETGIGLDSGQGSDPQVVLQWSDDGGHTWSNESWTSAGGKVGGVGDYKKRVVWRRLGSFRDRVFRVSITDPVPVTFLNAEIELEAGAS